MKILEGSVKGTPWTNLSIVNPKKQKEWNRQVKDSYTLRIEDGKYVGINRQLSAL